MLCLLSGLRDPRDADIRAAVRLVEPGGQHQPRRPPHGKPARGRRTTHEPQGEEAEAEAEEEERGQEAEAEAGAEQPRQEEEW